LLRTEATRTTSLTIERDVYLPADVSRTLELVFSPAPESDYGDLGVILVLRDVTEARALERQKDDFLANITHDMRSPLTAIKQSIGVILANVPDDFPEPLHRMLINTEGATLRMQVMVENLLDMAEMQQDRIGRQPAPVDLRVVVNRAADMVESLVQVRAQRLVRMICSEPLMVYADAGHLDRSITNLLDNAHKYGREGGSIWISLFEEHGRAVIRVEDDGPGIDPADHARVFERFVRFKNARGGAVPGTGLGLPIARSLMEMEGGELQMESTLGVGSAFSIVLPILDGDASLLDTDEGDLP
jgi:signal transduction histidine kinase